MYNLSFVDWELAALSAAARNKSVSVWASDVGFGCPEGAAALRTGCLSLWVGLWPVARKTHLSTG